MGDREDEDFGYPETATERDIRQSGMVHDVDGELCEPWEIDMDGEPLPIEKQTRRPNPPTVPSNDPKWSRDDERNAEAFMAMPTDERRPNRRPKRQPTLITFEDQLRDVKRELAETKRVSEFYAKRLDVLDAFTVETQKLAKRFRIDSEYWLRRRGNVGTIPSARIRYDALGTAKRSAYNDLTRHIDAAAMAGVQLTNAELKRRLGNAFDTNAANA